MIDEATIKVQAGDGGPGLVSFRREKFVPKGGPDGGDGGKGGDIFLFCSNEVNTLFDLNRLKQLKAKNGQPGGKNRSSGKSADDLVLPVPQGTIISQLAAGTPPGTLRVQPGATLRVAPVKIADLTQVGQRLLIAKGGKGGWGNWHFATSTQQAPRYAQTGEKGEQKTIKLELKLIAQVGLVGLPNVGKSSLLARISAAKPKIADYPFTTLEPILGVVNPKQWGIDSTSFVVADIPGLIEGASAGKGLGDQFLRHIERTKVLVHLLDATSQDLKQDYQIIRSELADFGRSLLNKPEIVVINKIDLKQTTNFKAAIKISGATSEGIDQLIRSLVKMLSAGT